MATTCSPRVGSHPVSSDRPSPSGGGPTPLAVTTGIAGRGRSDLVDESAVGPSGELPIHRVQPDVAEAGGDLCDSPQAGRIVLEEGENAVPTALSWDGVPVVAGGCGQGRLFGTWSEDDDAEVGDGAAPVGTSVVASLAVAGHWGLDLAGAGPVTAGGGTGPQVQAVLVDCLYQRAPLLHVIDPSTPLHDLQVR